MFPFNLIDMRKLNIEICDECGWPVFQYKKKPVRVGETLICDFCMMEKARESKRG